MHVGIRPWGILLVLYFSLSGADIEMLTYSAVSCWQCMFESTYLHGPSWPVGLVFINTTGHFKQAIRVISCYDVRVLNREAVGHHLTGQLFSNLMHLCGWMFQWSTDVHWLLLFKCCSGLEVVVYCDREHFMTHSFIQRGWAWSHRAVVSWLSAAQKKRRMWRTTPVAHSVRE